MSTIDTKAGWCEACRFTLHNECAGVIQHSDGDRYECECPCLPWEEEAANAALAIVTAGDDDD